MERKKGLLGRLVDAGVRTATEAAGAVLRDPRGQDAVARAIGAAQRGKWRVEEVQARVMKAAGIPGRQEYQDLVKQLARLKRKARELAEALERAPAPGPHGERVAGPEGYTSTESPTPPPTPDEDAGTPGGDGRSR